MGRTLYKCGNCGNLMTPRQLHKGGVSMHVGDGPNDITYEKKCPRCGKDSTFRKRR